MMARRTRPTAVGAICVVIVVVALMCVSLPKVVPLSSDEAQPIVRGDIASISVALKFYRLHFDVYPTAAQGLNILTNHFETESFSGPILGRPPIDPWGTPYQYSLLSNSFQVASAGPDKRPGTEDDVMSQ